MSVSPYLLLGVGAAWLASLAAAAHMAYGAGKDAETAAQSREDKAAAHMAYGAGKDAETAAQSREDKAAAVAADAAASAIAAAIPRITVRHETIRQEVEREIQTRDVYRNPDCDTGADSLRLFNTTIPGWVEPAAPGASAVPAPDAGH